MKFRNYLFLVNLSLKSWFSEAAVHRFFFKIGSLKNLAIFTGKHLCWPLQALLYLLWLLLDFRCSKYIFQLNLVFIADSTPVSELLWKHKLNVRSSHWNLSLKNGVFRILQYSQENNCVKCLLLMESQNFRPAALLKRDSNTDVFLRNLQSFLRTPN